MPKVETSPRAKRVWERLHDWYGARFYEQYGESPPEDWARTVDGVDNITIKRGLTQIRTKCPSHPPSFPEFETAMLPPKPSTHVATPAERLTQFVIEHYAERLTSAQLRGPWTYMGRRTSGDDGGIETIGVVIAPDGNSPGFRITVEDMEAAHIGSQAHD